MIHTTSLSGHILSDCSSLLLLEFRILAAFSLLLFVDLHIFGGLGRGRNMPYILHNAMLGSLSFAISRS